MGIIFTMGYGRTSKDEFVSRLMALRVHLSGPLDKIVIIDVRRGGSRSRNGRWAWQGYNMQQTARIAGALYQPWPELANPFRPTKAGLEQYAACLVDTTRLCWLRQIRNEPAFWNDQRLVIAAAYTQLVVQILSWQRRGMTACLLCSERRPTVPPTGRPRCHRVPLAEEVARDAGRLDVSLEVKHVV